MRLYVFRIVICPELIRLRKVLRYRAKCYELLSPSGSDRVIFGVTLPKSTLLEIVRFRGAYGGDGLCVK